MTTTSRHPAVLSTLAESLDVDPLPLTTAGNTAAARSTMTTAGDLAATALIDRQLGQLLSPEPARALVELGQLARSVEVRTHATVTTLRTAGVPWAAIGAGLGITKQGAQKRFR